MVVAREYKIKNRETMSWSAEPNPLRLVMGWTSLTLAPKLQQSRSRCLSHLDTNRPGSSRRHKGLAMDAPGETKANGDPENGLAENDASPRSRSPSDTNPDEHERRHQSSEDESEGSDDRDDDEDQDLDESDEEDEEPKLKYAYLSKHLSSVYRNGDATSTFLVAGDKMVDCSSPLKIHGLS